MYINMKQIFLLFIISFYIKADVAHGVLEKYRKRTLIASGIKNYINIARASNAGFKVVYSIEEDPVLINHTRHILATQPNIKIEKYYSFVSNPINLYEIIKEIKEPATFLLSNYLPDYDNPDKSHSLLLELDQISKHPIKTHTIMIEYIHYLTNPYFGKLSLEDIKNKLLSININYKFSFETGSHLGSEKNSVFVAYLK